MFKWWIGETEGITTEYTLTLIVIDAEMMTGVPGGIDKQELSVAEIIAIKIICDIDPAFVDRCDFAVKLTKQGFAINRHRTLDQPVWINHMPGAPGMNNEPCLLEQLHHSACATGMIEMNMSRDDIPDLAIVDAQVTQGGLDVFQRMAGTGVDNRYLIAFEQYINSGQLIPDMGSIDTINAFV